MPLRATASRADSKFAVLALLTLLVSLDFFVVLLPLP